MNTLQFLSAQTWVERLGWTLVHFLWQGTVVAVLYATVRKLARSASANLRYVLACAALATMMALPPLTWWTIAASGPQPASNHAAATNARVPIMTTGFTVPVPSASVQSNGWLATFLPVVVCIWMIGATAFWLRLIGACMIAARMRSIRTKPAPAEWQARLSQLGARIGLSRPARLVVSTFVQMPAVVGWLRPFVLVPAGALVGMPREQVEALLIHELAHIRRWDYLVNVLQSVAEALLFYHPAVWWVSGHLRIEREMCCDDIAVSGSGDVFAYVSALADLEELRQTSLSVSLGTGGGSLPRRIARLLGHTRPAPAIPPGPSVAAVAILLVASACAVFGRADTAPKFDVASIKPNHNTDPNRLRGMRPPANGQLTAVDVPVRMLIMNAYKIQGYQLIGAPDWAENDGFDIEAKGDPGANSAQVFLMVRSLLEDRFQLRFHRETRQLPVYSLRIAKNGPRLLAPKDGGCVTPEAGMPVLPGADGRIVPCGSPNIGPAGQGFSISGGKVPMTEFVRILQVVLGRPVIDQTGLTGPYDISFTFARDDVTAGLARLAGLPPISTTPDSDTGAPPSILSAIQQQLGLQLKGTKGPVEVMVIDQIEKPSPN